MTTLAKELTDKGYVYFDWNVSSGDAGEVKTTNEVYKNVINGIKGKKNQGLLPWDVHIMDEWNEKVKYKMSRLTFCIILDGKIKRIPQ